jgi:hypothetical protein
VPLVSAGLAGHNEIDQRRSIMSTKKKAAKKSGKNNAGKNKPTRYAGKKR